MMSLALHGLHFLDEKNGYIGGRGKFELIYAATVTSLHMVAHFFKLAF